MESAKNSFNWAILAPGKIAGKFADDLKYVDGAVVHAVASRSAERAFEFAKKHKAAHAVGDYKELINIPDIDCVYVASPHTYHYEHTMLCLEAGLNVLCEKPFAMHTRQVKEMVSLAKAKNVFLMEAMWTRFFPFMREVDHLLKKKVIGKIRSLNADFGFEAAYDPKSRLFDKALGGGALLDIGIYPIFMALYHFGYPDKITANADFAPTGADQSDHILFEYRDGRSAKLHATIMKVTDCKCIIRGDLGGINVHPRFHESKSISYQINGVEKTIDCGFEGRGYRWEVEHVQQCINNGLMESPIMNHAFSVQLIKLLDQVAKIIGLEYD